MKKIILTIIVIISSVFTMGIYTSADSEYDEISTAVPQKILVLGDSIATGYGLDGYSVEKDGCRSYANILHDEYAVELKDTAEIRLDNYAVDGMTSQGLLDNLNKGTYDKFLDDTDAVIISIGGNDLLSVLLNFIYVDLGLTVDSTFSDVEAADLTLPKIAIALKSMSDTLDKNITAYNDNLAGIAQYIHTRTDAQIIIQTLYNPLDNLGKADILCNLAAEKVDKLNDCISEKSTDENGEPIYSIADVFTAFSGQGTELTNILNGDIHPDAEGHKIISQVVDKAIRAYTYTIEIPKTIVETSSEPVQTMPEVKETSAKPAIMYVIFSACLLISVIVAFNRKMNK